MARRHGADETTLENLHDLDRTTLDAADKAAILYAERMTEHAGEIDDADLDALREHFDEDQIVEISCVVGLFAYLNRFAEAMGLWPTRPGEGGPEEAAD